MKINEEIEIIKFSPTYTEDFKNLNLEWISKYFKVEAIDITVLNNPQKYIIDKGGEIFFILYKGDIMGTCALVKSKNPLYDFELAKLAVNPITQGLKLGLYLCQAIIEEAKIRGGKTLFLETNSKLIPAINLYKKLGFHEIPIGNTVYERVDLVMLLNI